MHTIVIAFACIAHTGHGRRVLAFKELKEGNFHQVEHQDQQEALALLLSSCPPAAAWQVLGLDSRLTASGPKRPCAGLSSRIPFMREDWHAAGEELSDIGAEPWKKKKSIDPKFLIGNSFNNVSKLACTKSDIIYQGILETDRLPHICICGESNAGKSSLINHLLKKDNLAKASSTAGKTRSVDMMLVNDRVVLTDLPGLPSRDGQVSELWDRSFHSLIMDYIKRCETLLGMIYVHDIRWRVSPVVRQFLSEIRDQGLPVILVLTKDDKIASIVDRATPERIHNMRNKQMTRIRQALRFDGVHIHYSTDNKIADSRKARKILLRYIESMVKAGSRQESQQLLDTHGKKFSDITIRVPKKSGQDNAEQKETVGLDSK